MADGFVILGTVSIVGVVAIASIALVYNRSLWVRGTSSEIQVQTSADQHNISAQRPSKLTFVKK